MWTENLSRAALGFNPSIAGGFREDDGARAAEETRLHSQARGREFTATRYLRRLNFHDLCLWA